MKHWEPNFEAISALTNEEKAYIAGFFDGEGCMSLYRNGKNPACKLEAEITISVLERITVMSDQEFNNNVTQLRACRVND